MTAFSYDTYHYSRHVPWGGAVADADVIMFGPDYSGATFVLALAAKAGGAALKTITNAAAGTEGISATFDPNFTHPITGEQGSATLVRPQIDEASFEGLPWGADPAAPLVLSIDLLMTPIGAPQRAIYFGNFTLFPGIAN